jgi:hypothetical protein
MPSNPPDPWPDHTQVLRTTRRRVLLVFAGSFAASCGVGGLLLTPLFRQGPYDESGPGFTVLQPVHLAVLRAAAPHLLDAGADADVVIAQADRTLASMEPDLRKASLVHLSALENAGFALGARLRPFTQLTPQRQAAVLDQWGGSRILVCRQTVRLLRDLLVVHRWAPEKP